MLCTLTTQLLFHNAQTNNNEILTIFTFGLRHRLDVTYRKVLQCMKSRFGSNYKTSKLLDRTLCGNKTSYFLILLC